MSNPYPLDIERRKDESQQSSGIYKNECKNCKHRNDFSNNDSVSGDRNGERNEKPARMVPRLERSPWKYRQLRTTSAHRVLASVGLAAAGLAAEAWGFWLLGFSSSSDSHSTQAEVAIILRSKGAKYHTEKGLFQIAAVTMPKIGVIISPATIPSQCRNFGSTSPFTKGGSLLADAESSIDSVKTNIGCRFLGLSLGSRFDSSS